MFAGVYNLQMYLFTIRARYDLAMTLQSKVTFKVEEYGSNITNSSNGSRILTGLTFFLPVMSTERASKKRKTQSGCSGIELSSAFLVLQKFRDTFTTVTESDSDILENVENPELDVEMDQDALAQLDGLLQWMNSKIKFTTKVYLTACQLFAS